METTTTTKPLDTKNQISLRLPKEIYDAIEKLSVEQDRSINLQIIHLLKKAIRAYPMTTSKNKNELKSKSDTVTVFNSDNSVLRITEKYKELVKNSLIAFKNAIELGEELQTVKDNLPHGQFTKWIEKNTPFISERTARRYITIYKKQNILREKLGDNLELKKAYELLSKKPEKVINKIPEPEPSTLDLVKEHRIIVARNKSKLRKKKILPPPEIRTEVKEALLSDKEKEEIRIQKANDIIQKSISKLEEIQSDLHLLETANRTQ